jgi:hypothetical protein
VQREESVALTIQRIFYINLPSEVKRRKFMENWLSKTKIPYERVAATLLPLSSLPRDKQCGGARCSATAAGCPQEEPHRCRGIRGLIASNIKIIDTKNISGLTLVLEDDYRVNMMAISAAIQHVPLDWEIIRFNCKHTNRVPRSFDIVRRSGCPKFIPLIFKTQHVRHISNCTAEPCTFCGGTHATLWRNEKSAMKLRTLWSVKPARGIDCALTTDALQSYCVQGDDLGSFDKQTEKKSSIPKHLVSKHDSLWFKRIIGIRKNWHPRG